MSRWDSIALSNLFMHKTKHYWHDAVGFMTLLTIALPLLCVVQPACGKGVEYVIAVQTNRSIYPGKTNGTLARTAQLLSNRLVHIGISGRVLPKSENELLVQAVGVGLNEPADTNLARMLQKTGLLTIRHVHPESDLLTAQGIIDPGYQVMEELRENRDGVIMTNRILVAKTPANGLTSQRILRAAVSQDSYSNKPELSFEFDPEGTEAFARLTRDLQPKAGKRNRLAIVIDDVLYTAPYINEPIQGGRVRLTGSFTAQEALELATIMESPLGVSLKIVERRSLSPAVERQLLP